MPQVEQVVQYNAEDVRNLISADAKLKEGGVQGNQIKFLYEEKDGKQELSGAVVTFKR